LTLSLSLLTHSHAHTIVVVVGGARQILIGNFLLFSFIPSKVGIFLKKYTEGEHRRKIVAKFLFFLTDFLTDFLVEKERNKFMLKLKSF
jgi:hypothetical protein